MSAQATGLKTYLIITMLKVKKQSPFSYYIHLKIISDTQNLSDWFPVSKSLDRGVVAVPLDPGMENILGAPGVQLAGVGGKVAVGDSGPSLSHSSL